MKEQVQQNKTEIPRIISRPSEDAYKKAKAKTYELAEYDDLPQKKKKQESAGLLTVAGGLLLYFINNSVKKSNEG